MSTPTPAPREPSAAAQDASRELFELFRRLRALMRSLPKGDLTPAQTAVLLRLHKDGPSSTTVLAAAEGVRSQSMTGTLNSLDAAGLIERAADPRDGRRQVITLSRGGRERAARDRVDRHAWLAAAMDRRFTPAQLRTVREAIALLGELTEE